MADNETIGFCRVCGQQRMFTKPKVNHLLHLVLTVLTAGIWGITWIILGISNSGKPMRCTTCGTPMGADQVLPPTEHEQAGQTPFQKLN